MLRDDIRRRDDGSIDIDFYRVRAGELRAQAMRDAVCRTPFTKAVAIVAAALAIAALFMAPHRTGGTSVDRGDNLEGPAEIG